MLAVALMNMHVRRTRKLFCAALRQRGIEFHGMNFRKAVLHGRHHLAVICSGLNQHAQAVTLGVIADGALLEQVRRANGLAAQLPVPIVRVMAQRFVDAVKRGKSQEFAERFHGLDSAIDREQLPEMPKVPKNAKIEDQKLETQRNGGTGGKDVQGLSKFIASNVLIGCNVVISTKVSMRRRCLAILAIVVSVSVYREISG